MRVRTFKEAANTSGKQRVTGHDCLLRFIPGCADEVACVSRRVARSMHRLDGELTEGDLLVISQRTGGRLDLIKTSDHFKMWEKLDKSLVATRVVPVLVCSQNHLDLSVFNAHSLGFFQDLLGLDGIDNSDIAGGSVTNDIRIVIR